MKYVLGFLIAMIMTVPSWACHRVGFVSSFQLAQPFVPLTTVFAPAPVIQQQVFSQPLVQDQVLQQSYGFNSLGVGYGGFVQPSFGVGFNSLNFNSLAYGGRVGVFAPRLFVRPRVAVVAPRVAVVGGGFGVIAPRAAFVGVRPVVVPRAFIRVR